MVDQMNDPEADAALIGACLWSKKARADARRIIAGSDFYLPSYEAIWDAMRALDDRGDPVDPVSVSAVLRTTGRAGQAGLTVLPDLISKGISENAPFYAEIVREWSVRRQIHSTAVGLAQRALQGQDPAGKLASDAVTSLSSIRDGHSSDVSARTLSEIMAEPDDSPSWVIPGLLERGDRLMLTGNEGVGKSAMSRQLAVMSAAGVHPFTEGVIPPQRALIIDAENKSTQIRRQTRPLIRWLIDHGAGDPSDRVMVDALYPRRINLTSDRDLSAIHQTIDAFKPTIIVLGPIYRMSPRALQTDDDAHPFLAALDTLTERGCALIVEAHAGHSQESSGSSRGTERQLRPRGSSALLGWPEFGIGMRNKGGGLAEIERWRGDREERAWPFKVRRSSGNRWCEVSPDERPDQAPPIQMTATTAPVMVPDTLPW